MRIALTEPLEGGQVLGVPHLWVQHKADVLLALIGSAHSADLVLPSELQCLCGQTAPLHVLRIGQHSVFMPWFRKEKGAEGPSS